LSSSSNTKFSPTRASSRLGTVASPAAILNELPPPSQACTNTILDEEVSVSRMVIEKENENNGVDAGDLVEKTTGEIEMKMDSHEFEKEEEEKQTGRPPSLSLSPLSPSIFYPATPFAFGVCQL
jgi:hypothetical protein